ncbi:NUDIX hydrolase [Streptomyces spiroverticillatus]|uniref:NUDIX hydrolase n=1 Tax=Streptomyces finlayi TaxID=67296 RepID=A0A919C9H4_9ACTN|nr:NUDIX domain-containing protein [Streptomyces finlayi]GHA07057.1 NUDIX hydrolase [Streptomyces spiroverticillatus]GHC90482.1 NUDIX hydrolase [Streptomyces finlayi]
MAEFVDRVDDQDRVLGIVDRSQAIREGWLHRVATTVCRDGEGRVLVHRRPPTVSRFPGQYNWLLGGAVNAGESYQAAAERELEEELGVRAPVRPLFSFLCRGEISPYWLAVHEALVTGPVTPDPGEVDWYDWLDRDAFRRAMREWPFVSDSRKVFQRYEQPG